MTIAVHEYPFSSYVQKAKTAGGPRLAHGRRVG